MVNIVGLSNLRGDGDDDARAPNPNQYYAGGASQQGGGSGLSVIGPDNGPSADQMANIVARAQQDAREAAGRGSGGPPRYTITFYRDGFTVNDGPYRARTDPENRPFLEAIERGYAGE